MMHVCQTFFLMSDISQSVHTELQVNVYQNLFTLSNKSELAHTKWISELVHIEWPMSELVHAECQMNILYICVSTTFLKNFHKKRILWILIAHKRFLSLSFVSNVNHLNHVTTWLHWIHQMHETWYCSDWKIALKWLKTIDVLFLRTIVSIVCTVLCPYTKRNPGLLFCFENAL